MHNFEWYDWLEKNGYVVNVDYHSSLRNIPKNIHHVKYPDGSIREFYEGSCLVDPLFRSLIFDLNKAGFTTYACCQGRTKLEQFGMEDNDPRKHSPEAYIAFERIPSEILDKLRKQNISISSDKTGTSISTYMGLVLHEPIENGSNVIEKFIERCDDQDKPKIIEANLLFERKVREAFGI